MANVELLTFDRQARTSASDLEPASLRSLDAIHVATALGLPYSGIVFVGYDHQLQAAASAAGLEVASPGR